jgi:hypothetical protein
MLQLSRGCLLLETWTLQRLRPYIEFWDEPRAVRVAILALESYNDHVILYPKCVQPYHDVRSIRLVTYNCLKTRY